MRHIIEERFLSFFQNVHKIKFFLLCGVENYYDGRDTT